MAREWISRGGWDVSFVSLKSLSGEGGVLFARLLVAGVFGYAAVPKLIEPDRFAEAIANYHLLPSAMVGIVAVIVPVIEVVIAVMLVVGVEARGAALAAAILLTAFSVAMAQAIVRDINLDCGCFGSTTQSTVGWSSVVRNGGFLLPCAWVVARPDASWSRRKSSETGTQNVPSGDS